MRTESLEELIQRYVVLGKVSPKGFHPVKCAGCSDYKERGGFKFEGESVLYHCFNCGVTAKYVPDVSRHAISRKLKEILLAFGIPEVEIDRSVGFNFFKPAPAQATPTEKQTALPLAEVPLPAGAVLVSSGFSPWCEVAEVYLNTRALKSTDYRFFVADGKYAGRLIIPYYFRDRVIYWQGRSMDAKITPRYKNPTAEKDNVFFNMDELYRYTADPLFVVEGPLDAVSIGKQAIALLGSSLTDFKRAELKRVAERRPVTFVIDKNSNGRKLGTEVLASGWRVVVFPDNVDDANDALQKFGKLWLTSWITAEAKGDFAGKLQLEMSCK